MADSKNWQLDVRNGSTDEEICKLFVRVPFRGVHRIKTVDGLGMPRLWNPAKRMVVSGETNIRRYLREHLGRVHGL